MLHRRILRRDVRVGVIGLGYVGLPLARAIAECGFAVTGFGGRFRATADFSAIVAVDAVLICTDHDAVDDRMLAERARLVVDTRNACAGSTAGSIVRA